MISIMKYRKIIISLALLIIFIFLTISVLVISNRDINIDIRDVNIIKDNKEPINITLTLRKNEVYDIKDELKEARELLKEEIVKQTDGYYDCYAMNNGVARLSDTRIKAINAGVTSLFYNLNYILYRQKSKYSSERSSITTLLLTMRIIVLDEEEDYVPVYKAEDITSENKTFILMNDIVVSNNNQEQYFLKVFRGTLINPEGYKITVNNSNLFNYNIGWINDLIIDGEISGENINTIGGIATTNSGYITNCISDVNIQANYIMVWANDMSKCIINGTYTLIENTSSGLFLQLYNCADSSIVIYVTGYTEKNVEERDEIIEGNNTIKIQILEVID